MKVRENPRSPYPAGWSGVGIGSMGATCSWRNTSVLGQPFRLRPESQGHRKWQDWRSASAWMQGVRKMGRKAPWVLRARNAKLVAERSLTMQGIPYRASAPLHGRPQGDGPMLTWTCHASLISFRLRERNLLVVGTDVRVTAARDALSSRRVTLRSGWTLAALFSHARKISPGFDVSGVLRLRGGQGHAEGLCR